MHDLVRENLEDYLAGTLDEAKKAEIDALLAANPQAAQELALYQESSLLFQELRVSTEEAEQEPGFYARVMERVEQEQRVPFWAVFLQPLFARQLVFACLMCFALLGAYVAVFGSNQPSPYIAESILTERPLPEYNVRLGADLDRNRESMLATLVAMGD